MKRYIRASFNNEVPTWLKQNKGALQALSSKGIDLANLTLTQDKARKGDTDSQYTVYLVDTGYYRPFVWIPGVYNDNELMTDPRDRSKYRAVKYIPRKHLNILETWYINVNDNHKQGKKRYEDPRYEYSRYDKPRYAGQRYYIPDHVKDPSSPEADEWGYRPATSADGKWLAPKEGRDKSGYLIPKPSERLIDFFNSERGLKSLGNRLHDVYEDLIDLRENIFRVDFTSFGKTSNGDPDYNSNAYDNMLSEFGRTCRNYKMALKYLKSAQEVYEERRSEEYRYSEYNIREAFDYIRSIKKSIKDLRRVLETESYW